MLSLIKIKIFYIISGNGTQIRPRYTPNGGGERKTSCAGSKRRSVNVALLFRGYFHYAINVLLFYASKITYYNYLILLLCAFFPKTFQVIHTRFLVESSKSQTMFTMSKPLLPFQILSPCCVSFDMISSSRFIPAPHDFLSPNSIHCFATTSCSYL